MLPRRFALVRHVDYSGISGIGVVAYGVVFTDGHVALRWTSDHPATSTWSSIDDLVAVHGHGEATSIEWLDPADVFEQPVSAPSRGRRARRSGPIVTAADPPQTPQTPPAPPAPPTASAPAVDHHDSPGHRGPHAVPSQRRTGRHRRASTEQESRPTAPIESDWT